MAEQANHNVVDQSESTSGSAPLVDVAANLKNNIAAENGTQASLSNQIQLPGSDNQTPLTTSHKSSVGQADAEPSAGDAFIPTEDGLPDSHGQALNGDGEEGPALSADTGRADMTEQAKESAQHNRTNSVKKPATFSKVSVTKNFLARSATATPTATKPGDKVIASAIPMPALLKPRLVAKSASMLGNMSRPRPGAESTAGPDANKVWNKNRPTPAMPPKQFTDEELKQQYGIHLATRLQSDETGKGSKWADIDDDEDDWAPDSVVWMDGTKSTLATTDMPTPTEEKPQTPSQEKTVNAIKPNLLAMKKPSEPSGPPKTILKPGAAVQAKQQAGPNTLSNSSSEKQTLKAKSPAPVPAKSPWATLPPVDKISPINPPVQSHTPPQPTFMASQDARFSDMPAQVVSPAREIAADTFDRAWRGAEGERRELFNSASGKYEPAPEGRRTSIRPESYGRKPSVLQRAQDGPNGSDAGSWPHRRGSSVSQNSGPRRRMSFARDSESAFSDHHSGTGTSQEPRSALATPSFPQQSPWAQQLPPPPSSGGEDNEDVLKAQERIMRESREAARRRRQEEEAREEAAKKERLQAKLNALAGAGQSRKEREAAAAKEEIAPLVPDSDTQSSMTAVAESAIPSAQPESVQVPTTAPVRVDAQAPSPAATQEGAPRQTDLTETAPQQHLSPSTASRSTLQSQATTDMRTSQSSAFSSPATRDRKPQPFGRSPIAGHETFNSWASSGPGGNVWGTSGIGNGTFESSSMFAPLSSLQQKSLPLPPGMGRPVNATISQSIGHSSHSPQVANASLDQNQPSSSNVDVRQDHFGAQTLPNGMSSAPGTGRQQHAPGPIGPPSRMNQQASVAGSAWQSSSQRLPPQYQVDADSAVRSQIPGLPSQPQRYEGNSQMGRDALGASRKFDFPDYTVHGSRNVTSPMPPNTQTQPALSSPSESPVNQWKQPGNAVRLPGAVPQPVHDSQPQQQAPIGRPHVANLSKPNFTPAPLAPATSVSNESPPPPEEVYTHPAFDGNMHKPNVRLPPPSAVVRLPPSNQPVDPNMMMMHGRVQNYNQRIPRPLVEDEAWQARFNVLFNRAPISTEIPPSPPRTPPKSQAPVLAVASSSRVHLDDVQVQGATVSIPRLQNRNRSAEGFTVDNSSDVVSKPQVQHMFYDDLGFGSRPAVRLPSASCYDESRGSSGANLLDMRPSHKDPNSVVAQTQREPLPAALFYKNRDGVVVKMQGWDKHKFIPYPRKPQRGLGSKLHASRGAAFKKEASLSPASTSKTAPQVRKTSKDVTAASPRKRSGLHKASKPAQAAPATGTT